MRTSLLSIGALLGLGLACAEDSCFTAGTLIDTPNGKRRIEDLSVGDAVLSFDARTGNVVARSVKTVMRDRVRTIVRVETESMALGGVTPSHPFYVVERAEYLALRDVPRHARLLVLSECLEIREETIRALSIEESPTPSFEVYNFETDGPEHNYFANGILVHNKEPAGYCGDGYTDTNLREQCDDGNQRDGDGCSATCRVEVPDGGAADGGAAGGGGASGEAGAAGSGEDAGAAGSSGSGGTGV